MALGVGTFTKLKNDILNADQLPQLRSLRDQFQLSIQQNEQLHKDSIAELNNLINDIHDALIVKTISLAEIRMVGEGLGPPPASYSYLLLGSAGRSEQTMASDQDSALIYEDHTASEKTKAYFLTFTQYVVSMLMELGYPPCDGKVQSNESMWCQSESEWKEKLEQWFQDADWESVRYLLIVADARCIAGDDLLFNRIRTFFEQGLVRYTNMLERMIENTVQHKVVVGIFGQFITDRYGDHVGSIDVKYGSYIPIVNSVRWLSLNAAISETSTLSRLEKLKERGQFSEEDYEKYRKAFLQMLSLRLLAGYHEEDGMYKGYSKLNPKRLDSDEIKRLKRNLRYGKEVQKLVLKEMARHK